MIDLQHALRLYRRQGAVASQDKHLGRSLVSGPYPVRGSTYVQVLGDVNIELVEVVRPNFYDGLEVPGADLQLVLKATTNYVDAGEVATSTAVVGIPDLRLQLKETTSYVTVDDAGKSELTVPGADLQLVLTPEAIVLDMHQSVRVKGRLETE